MTDRFRIRWRWWAHVLNVLAWLLGRIGLSRAASLLAQATLDHGMRVEVLPIAPDLGWTDHDTTALLRTVSEATPAVPLPALRDRDEASRTETDA